MWLFICACCLCRSSRILADGVNEPENADVGDEYREFDAEDPDCQQEFAEDADGGKSNRFPLMHIDPIFKHNP